MDALRTFETSVIPENIAHYHSRENFLPNIVCILVSYMFMEIELNHFCAKHIDCRSR
jgi:hypothetical protein